MPVPDMSDSIWSGIEMQLDADAPDKKPAKNIRNIRAKAGMVSLE